MKEKNVQRQFNVITWDFNSSKFIPYNIIPYLVDCYKEASAKNKPKTFEEFKKFVKGESLHQWWGRCEYEIILSDWPSNSKNEKWDVYQQIEMNLDLVTELVMQSCGKETNDE